MELYRIVHARKEIEHENFPKARIALRGMSCVYCRFCCNAGALTVEDAQYILIYYTENTVAGKSLTWDDLLNRP